jgi:hypothetical protein
MTGPGNVNERERMADELRRVREEVRQRALHEPAPPVLPPTLPTRTPEGMPPDPVPPPLVEPRRPDATELNGLWPLFPTLEGGGLRRAVARGLARTLARLVGRQEHFNSQQVQFDNQVLDYIDARFAATHAHYDPVLGIVSRHMAEIDERHLILQEELVSHVHDLVKRIDLVLAQGEKGRLSLEYALQDVRTRLLQLEERLGRG